MKKVLLCTAIASAIVGVTAQAQAAVTMTIVNNALDGYLAAPQLTIADDFQSTPVGPSPAGATRPNGATLIGDYQIVAGNVGSQYALIEPAVVGNQYLSIPLTTGSAAGGSTFLASYTFSSNIYEVGFFWGTPDSHNTVTLYDGANLVGSVSGGTFGLGGGGSSGEGRYVNLSAFGATFNKITFQTAAAYSGEFDNIAINAVPEPGEWAMMIAGLGVVSLIARRRKLQA
jgi:hypothetical protein